MQNIGLTLISKYAKIFTNKVCRATTEVYKRIPSGVKNNVMIYKVSHENILGDPFVSGFSFQQSKGWNKFS